MLEIILTASLNIVLILRVVWPSGIMEDKYKLKMRMSVVIAAGITAMQYLSLRAKKWIITLHLIDMPYKKGPARLF